MRRADVPEAVSSETNGEEPVDDPDPLWAAGAAGRYRRGAAGGRIAEDGVVEELRPRHQRTRHACEQRGAADLVSTHRCGVRGIARAVGPVREGKPGVALLQVVAHE